MKYYVVDGYMGGTGLREKYDEDFVDVSTLPVSPYLIEKIKKWQKKYENNFWYGYKDAQSIFELDQEGLEIAKAIANEMDEVKVEYFSDAFMKTTII